MFLRAGRGDDGLHGLCNIAEINGLELRLPTADNGQEGAEPRHLGKAVKEIIFGAEDNAGAQHGAAGKGLRDRVFAQRLRAAIG